MYNPLTILYRICIKNIFIPPTLPRLNSECAIAKRYLPIAFWKKIRWPKGARWIVVSGRRYIGGRKRVIPDEEGRKNGYRRAACGGYLALGIESISRSQPGSDWHPLFCFLPARPARKQSRSRTNTRALPRLYSIIYKWPIVALF